MEQIKVVADMTADLFHSGHVNLLRNARKRFSNVNLHLTVALHTDEQILSYKNKLPVMNYECRKEVLSACRYVDEVIRAPDMFDRDFIDRFDYLVHGDDLLNWDKALLDRWYKEVIKQDKLILLPYSKEISTTILRKNAELSAGLI